MRALPLVLAVALLAGCGQTPPPAKNSDNAGKKDPPTASKEAKEVKEVKPASAKLGVPDFTMPAKQLLDEFEKDNKASAAKYKGKTVELTDLVESVSISPKGEARVMLGKGPTDREFVQCDIAELYPAKRVAPGQTATIKGRMNELYSGAALVACEIVKVEGPASLALTADEMAEEMAKGAAGMPTKLQKWLLVSGEVEEVKGGAFIDVVLKTKAKAPRVVARFMGFATKQAQGLKPGQKVELLGMYSTLVTKGDEARLFSCVLASEPK